MKTEFWVTGKLNHQFLDAGIAYYQKRINFYLPFEIQEIRSSKAKTIEESIRKEEEEYLKRLRGDEKLILLDEAGKQYSSTAFAEYLQSMFNSSPKKLVFLSGGAYGFGEKIKEKADAHLSLSTMTFTHDMVRLIFVEQFYRALTIIHKHPYQH